MVQNTCKSALIYSQPPSATSSSTLPVVSEWYQSGIKRPGAIGRFWLNRTEALQDRGYENPITPFYAFG